MREVRLEEDVATPTFSISSSGAVSSNQKQAETCRRKYSLGSISNSGRSLGTSAISNW